eukprot:1171362-Pleurochrysis_carterae.AAC.1
MSFVSNLPAICIGCDCCATAEHDGCVWLLCLCRSERGRKRKVSTGVLVGSLLWVVCLIVVLRHGRHSECLNCRYIYGELALIRWSDYRVAWVVFVAFRAGRRVNDFSQRSNGRLALHRSSSFRATAGRHTECPNCRSICGRLALVRWPGNHAACVVFVAFRAGRRVNGFSQRFNGRLALHRSASFRATAGRHAECPNCRSICDTFALVRWPGYRAACVVFVAFRAGRRVNGFSQCFNERLALHRSSSFRATAGRHAECPNCRSISGRLALIRWSDYRAAWVVFVAFRAVKAKGFSQRFNGRLALRRSSSFRATAGRHAECPNGRSICGRFALVGCPGYHAAWLQLAVSIFRLLYALLRRVVPISLAA